MPIVCQATTGLLHGPPPWASTDHGATEDGRRSARETPWLALFAISWPHPCLGSSGHHEERRGEGPGDWGAMSQALQRAAGQRVARQQPGWIGCKQLASARAWGLGRHAA